MGPEEIAARDGTNLGKLILIGGNEDKSESMLLLRAIANESGGSSARIEVITTASSEPDAVGSLYEKAFQTIGVAYVKAMNIGTRAEAESKALADRIDQATAVLFSGGDQLRITSILEATPVSAAIRRHYFEKGRLVAGTSAGAAALTGTIIYDGESPDALKKGAVKMTAGLALISDAIVDTHFVTRGRMGRLIHVVASNPRLIGIGLGEDTGILVAGGTRFVVMGNGLVLIVDGSSMGYTNVTDVLGMQPFSVENVRVHVLSAGAGFDLTARKFMPPPKRDAAPGDAAGR